MPRDLRNEAAKVPLSTRRSVLFGGVGLGAIALAGLSGAWPGRARGGELSAIGVGAYPVRAKRVLHVMMWGGFSQVDTFDYKPVLVKRHGEELPASVRNAGGRISTMSGAQSSFPLIAPVCPYTQYGESGMWISDLLPHMGRVADELCVVKSVWTEHVNHDPAAKFLHTGFQLSGRPSAGAWVNYALGTDNADLPTFVAMQSGGHGGVGTDAAAWGSGFLPSHYQGVMFGDGKDPVLYVSRPDGIDQSARRAQLDVIGRLARQQSVLSHDPEIDSKVRQYEMAYRMQQSVPEAVDLSREPRHVLDMYGPEVELSGSFAKNCILARRLIERNVKYVQLMHTGWDAHSYLARSITFSCAQIDQPLAALIADLKQRGLLEDTLVVISTEFGRTSYAQGTLDAASYGRDHHGGCFAHVFAGAGVKAGHVHGETDDFSYNIVRDPVHVHDIQATVLYLLGIDHTRLTYRFQGRDFRLTDTAGEVVRGIVA